MLPGQSTTEFPLYRLNGLAWTMDFAYTDFVLEVV
jgi:hypothetical protein